MKFQCSRCGEAFADLDSFLYHMEEAHGRGPVDTGRMGPQTFEAVDSISFLDPTESAESAQSRLDAFNARHGFHRGR